jgi:hypothetical protein
MYLNQKPSYTTVFGIICFTMMLVQYKEEIQSLPILLIQPLKHAIQAIWVSSTYLSNWSKVHL